MAKNEQLERHAQLNEWITTVSTKKFLVQKQKRYFLQT